MDARYSPVAPIALLENLFAHEEVIDKLIVGHYLLLLTHDVLNYPGRYKALIERVRRRYESGGDTFIIMDNSVVELGEAMDVSDVISAAHVVNAECIMTPDVLGDAEATKKLVAEQANQLLTCNFPLMRVPQGKDNAELIKCVDWLDTYLPSPRWAPSYWGIPRWVTNELGSRIPIITHISTGMHNSKIHLLGTSNNYEDDCRCCWMPKVMGIDSANPLVMGYAGFDIMDGWMHMQRGNYWDLSRIDPKVLANLAAMRNEITY